jgi:regulator of PEP synthase PpsR (kinase-PPPase family)
MSGSTMEEFADNMCSEFEDLKPICEHFMTSAQSDRYVKVYIALLQNNLTIIDEDLHAQVADTCETCKSTIQSVKDFWMNSLVSEIIL